MHPSPSDSKCYTRTNTDGWRISEFQEIWCVKHVFKLSAFRLFHCHTNKHLLWLIDEAEGRAWHRCPKNYISSHIFLALKGKMYLTPDTLLILKLGVHCSVLIPRLWLDISKCYEVKSVLGVQLYIKRKTNEDWFSLNYYPLCINIQRAIASYNSYDFCHSWQFMAITGLGPDLFHLPIESRYSFCEAYFFDWHLFFLWIQNTIIISFSCILCDPWDLTSSILLTKFSF